jgi:hypothetical protein
VICNNETATWSEGLAMCKYKGKIIVIPASDAEEGMILSLSLLCVARLYEAMQRVEDCQVWVSSEVRLLQCKLLSMKLNDVICKVKASEVPRDVLVPLELIGKLS